MYSELYRIMTKDSTFSNSVFKNPSVTKQSVAGIYVSVRLSEKGEVVSVRCKKDNEMMIGIAKDNSNIFPKYNFNYGSLSVKNLPDVEVDIPDFSQTEINVVSKQKDLEKPLKYSKELLIRFAEKGQTETMIGKLLTSVSKIEDVKALFSNVFSIIKTDSLTDGLANTFMKELVKIKSDSKKPTVKIPIIFYYSENGLSSLDSDDESLDVISRTVQMPPSKMTKYGESETEVYKNLPKYKFPCGISSRYIFARNCDAASMSVYGKYGSDTFVLSTDKCNNILSYLDHILPIDGDGSSFMQISLSRFKNGIMAIVFNEEMCKKNILRFFAPLSDKAKEFEIKRYKKELIDSVRSMKQNDNNLNSPVEILLIGAVDKASVGLVSSLNITKQKVLDRIEEWNDADLPRPEDLIKCMKTRSKQDRNKINYKLEKNRGLFGYDSLLEFSFGENRQLTSEILKKLVDNLRAYVILYSNIKPNKIGEQQIKFLKYVSERTEKTQMSEHYKTLGKLLKFGDALQLKYWKNKKIKGVNQKTIGSQVMSLVMQSRTKDAFMEFHRNILKYIDWAESEIRNSQNNGRKYDKGIEYVLNVIRSEMTEAKKIELSEFFTVRPTDIDMSTVMIEYVSR